MSTGRTCKAALKFPMVRDRGPPLAPDGLIYALRAAADLLNGINLIWPVQSCLQKYFASPVGQIISTNSRHPVPQGAYRDRHGRGVGCGGRGSVLRATGSQGGFYEFVSDHQASGREMLQRTAKSCGPDTPTLVSSLRSCVGPTGLRQNISADDGGKRARSPGRARHKRVPWKGTVLERVQVPSGKGRSGR